MSFKNGSWLFKDEGVKAISSNFRLMAQSPQPTSKGYHGNGLKAATNKQEWTKPMNEKQKRIRVNNIMSAGGIAHEHGRVLKMAMRQMIDPALASRLSGMFVNQRVLIEYVEAEKRIAELEALLEAALQGKTNNVIPLKVARG
jgi:hypothetical protein